jgi:hypothetical protein
MSVVKTYRVVFTIEVQSHIEADSEEEAVRLAREGLVGAEDGMTIVAEEAMLWAEEGETRE